MTLPYIITRRYRQMIEYILENYTEEEVNRARAYVNLDLEIPMRLSTKM